MAGNGGGDKAESEAEFDEWLLLPLEPPPLNCGISNARARSLLLFADDDEGADDGADDDDDEDDDDTDEDEDFDCDDDDDDESGAFGSTNVVEAGKCSRLGLCTSLMIGCNALSPKCSWISWPVCCLSSVLNVT